MGQNDATSMVPCNLVSYNIDLILLIIFINSNRLCVHLLLMYNPKNRSLHINNVRRKSFSYSTSDHHKVLLFMACAYTHTCVDTRDAFEHDAKKLTLTALGISFPYAFFRR